MKFLLAFVAVVAVAVAQPTKRPQPVSADSYEPIAVGPAIVDLPTAPSPVVIGDINPSQPAPLVQLIVNVNQPESSPIAPAPVVVPSEETQPHPVIVVEQPAILPVPEIAPQPVIIVEQPESVLEPVQVVEVVPVEPVIVGTPIIPAPAVILPDTLN